MKGPGSKDRATSWPGGQAPVLPRGLPLLQELCHKPENPGGFQTLPGLEIASWSFVPSSRTWSGKEPSIQRGSTFYTIIIVRLIYSDKQEARVVKHDYRSRPTAT